jgi:NAD(P)-dependent dehydrogenase (short-subunit alcohol dehydrogenase family)
VILADLNGTLLEETAQAILRAGHNVKHAVLDVSDYQAVKKLIDDTVSENGRLDYLFNNAGIGVAGEARDVSYDDWRRVIDVNLYGAVNGVVAAYPVMVKQGFGHIINTASLAGLVPAGGEISYTASKYGIVGLSNALRVEGADLGVKVSVICPGFIETPILYTSKMVKVDRDKLLEMAPKTMPPDKCALVILRGVEKNKATIVVTFLAKAMWILQRISPNLMIWIWKHGTRRVRRAARIEE